MQIGLIGLLQRGHLGRWNYTLNVNESLMKKRPSAVPVGEVEEKFPTDRLARHQTQAFGLLLAGNFGTRG